MWTVWGAVGVVTPSRYNFNADGGSGNDRFKMLDGTETIYNDSYLCTATLAGNVDGGAGTDYEYSRQESPSVEINRENCTGVSCTEAFYGVGSCDW